jgi:F-type H+-transporting ATPase subunit epsilon
MTPFPLRIVTPDGIIFDGDAEELIVRTTTGDIGILAGHVNCVAPLGMGRATVVIEGQRRYAACMGGLVSVLDGQTELLPTTFEWSETIDPNRAERSMQRAQTVLSDKDSSNTDIALAEARMKRALVRQNVASLK